MKINIDRMYIAKDFTIPALMIKLQYNGRCVEFSNLESLEPEEFKAFIQNLRDVASEIEDFVNKEGYHV